VPSGGADAPPREQRPTTTVGVTAASGAALMLRDTTVGDNFARKSTSCTRIALAALSTW
jgi:hypothetical protein